MNKNQPQIRWRLRTKLLASILILVLILMAAIMLLVEQHLRKSMLDEFARHGLSIGHSLAAVNIDYVTTYNYVKIDQHLGHTVDEHNLLYAAVMLFDGEVASYKENTDLREEVLFGELQEQALNTEQPLIQHSTVGDRDICDISVPVTIDGHKWATVRIGLALDSLQIAISEMRSLLVGLGLFGLILSSFAAIILARRITKPVQCLVGNLQAIARGQYDLPIHITTKDEIGYFGYQFAHMQQTLKKQFDLLEEKNSALFKSNTDLQSEINERKQKENELEQEIIIRHKKETALRQSEERLANAQRIAKLGYWEWDKKSDVVLLSETAMQLVGIKQPQTEDRYEELIQYIPETDRYLINNAIRASIVKQRGASIEHQIIRTDGEKRFVHHEIEANFNEQGTVIKIVGTLQDITERKDAEEHIRYLAHFDSVTGLPNRAYMQELLNQWIRRGERYGHVVAILFLDLDHFKRINDTLGHSAGDELLRQVADRLTDCVRASDCVGHEANGKGNSVARLGGDEFVVLLSDIVNLHDASIVAKRILHVFSQPFELDSNQVVVTPSIGISGFPSDGGTAESLLKHADVAMYHAKSKGRNGYQFYSASMNAFMQERLSLENELRQSMKDHHFQLYYQPKIDTNTGAVIGMETLLRWNHPVQGFISPAKFIPVAEETGLIVPLGEWVLRTACEQLSEWQKNGLPPLKLAVNLSVAQFRQKNLIKNIKYILNDSKLDPQLLELELTESMLMENVEASIVQLEELKSIGISLSIDDFGTGYSSLSYLKRFPIETLKIDQSFIREVTVNSNDAAIVNATIALGHKLGLTIVAEGVETLEQVHFLQAENCDQLQGYYFSKPLPADEFIEFVTSANSNYTLPNEDFGSCLRSVVTA